MNLPISIACALTAVYLLFGAIVLGARLPDLLLQQPLSNVGDFLAGFFAPLAFLWLVVSLFLQRKELELMREEQALARSQRDNMVSAAQMELYSKSPNLKISTVTLIRLAADSKRVVKHPLYLEIKVSNDGGALATELKINIQPTEESYLFLGDDISGETIHSGENTVFTYGLAHDLSFEDMRKDETFMIELKYSDMFGITQTKSYWSWIGQTSYYELRPTILHLELTNKDEA
jgi:hypothetical protein